jgi:L-amino acid N-acyltransferase YncA
VSSAPPIRPGTLDDAPGMARLINAVIAEGAPVLLTGAFSEEQERAYLAALPARAGFHVAESPGGREGAGAEGGAHAAPELVAAQVFVPFAAGMPAHDHVAEMGTWVDAAWRRHGLGRALWERTSALARERGFTKVFTDVRADNVDSLAFHLALGFSVAGVARGQAVIDGRVHDVVFIERGL